MNDALLPIEFLEESFFVDEGSWSLLWKKRPRSHFADERAMATFNARYAGKPAGRLVRGYVVVKISRRTVGAHRIIFALTNHRNANGFIDHVDGDRTNNNQCNLREVDNALNMQNQRAPQKTNKCGFLGVDYHKKSRKFRSAITTNGARVYLGYFDTAEAAHAAYVEAKRKLHKTCAI